MSALCAWIAALCLGFPEDDAALRQSQERAPMPAGATGHASSSVARASRRALEDGLAYLARRQAETVNGSFPVDDASISENRAPVGITALATLAFMAAGNLPGRGPYGREVERALDYLIEHTDLSPESPKYGFISSSGDKKSQTHGHGYATLVLAQAYGMSDQRERIGTALRAAVDQIQRSQGAEGGWEYEYFASVNHEGSVTICLVQALRAARNVGIQVDSKVIARAEAYVKRLQKPDGTFRYTIGDERSTIGLTAAAISTLNMAGTYDNAVIQNAVDAIWSGLEIKRESSGRRSQWPFYERLYLTQAFWQHSDASNFQRWYPECRETVIRDQASDGSWMSRDWGSCYATAVNCLVLALPEGVLPIFQR